ncbi:carboxylic ester hydrolase [Ktedonosporobacter rubrisoli]|uniref:Carboxylic ester hydrolase n=1 Tax=Ktedonosporobacter rubrisoli TaxID=2509675 RepID=A0A4V0YY27_KTERU|nr:carboxylic ester hydrolase [Ktedonosporobacter rubrisoli]QBD74761.1 carboxylic ester hydrolase [Ktedonosporobacter rubrisoli]
MRPLEILLVCANLITFLLLAVPRLRVAQWKGYIVLSTLALAVVQIVLEGPRWQMAPAYGLTGLFALAWALQRFVPANRIAKSRLKRRLIASLASTVCVIGMALSIALPLLLPVFSFPRPSGPYAIGTVTYHWTDHSRHEIFSPDKNGPRELMVQIWYPSSKGQLTLPAPYLPDAAEVTPALEQLHHFPKSLLQHLKYVKTHAAESVPVANDRPGYPVLIALEGITGYRQMLTFQIEELVSHGYIVVGLDQPGVAASVTFPDGHSIAITELFTQIETLIRQSVSPAQKAPQFNGQTFTDGIIPYFAQDVSFTLDRLASLNTRDPQHLLTGKLDLGHVGLFGMSLGGMIGAQACLQDARLGACLIIDVEMTDDVLKKGLHQPCMLMTRPADTMRLERQKAGGWTEQDIARTQLTMRAVYNHLPGDGYFVQIPGAFHIDFTDLDLFSPLAPLIGLGGPLGSQRAHEIVNAYSLAFFDKHLKGQPEALLTGPAARYPEVIFARHGP